MATLFVGRESYSLRFWEHGVYHAGQWVPAHLDRKRHTLDVDARLSPEQFAQAVVTLFGEKRLRRGWRPVGRKYIDRVPVAMVPIKGAVPNAYPNCWDACAPGSALSGR
jgi:hypothetical protein